MHRPLVLTLAPTAIALFGCPNPNTYTSARTLPHDDVQVLAAVEGYGMVDPDGVIENDEDMEADTFQSLASLPTIGIRYGASDSVDVGLRAVNLGSAALDTKVQLVRGRLDLAVNPGVQWHRGDTRIDDSREISVNIVDVHLPVLLGWNINKRASLVLSPGVVIRSSLIDSVDHDLFGVTGIGLNVRVTRSFAVQPQVSAAWDIAEGEGGFVVAGLGFTFGGQPNFDDLDAQTTESPSPVARR